MWSYLDPGPHLWEIDLIHLNPYCIGNKPHLKISCHFQNLSFWSNHLCRIKKSVRWGFWVWFLAPSKPHTLVHIKMWVSSLTTLHNLCQTLSFSTISKEQHLFKSVTKLNPVFQPISTVTFHWLLHFRMQDFYMYLVCKVGEGPSSMKLSRLVSSVSVLCNPISAWKPF